MKRSDNFDDAVKFARKHFVRNSFYYGKVMVYSITKKPRKLKLYEDFNGLYVRIGKGKTVKIYLHEMSAAKITMNFPMPVFYE